MHMKGVLAGESSAVLEPAGPGKGSLCREGEGPAVSISMRTRAQARAALPVGGRPPEEGRSQR